MSDDREQFGGDDDLAVEACATETQTVRRCTKVLLLNDDYTRWSLSYTYWSIFFRMDREKGHSGHAACPYARHGVCGVFSKDVAETKVAQVNDHSRQPASIAVHPGRGVKQVGNQRWSG